MTKEKSKRMQLTLPPEVQLAVRTLALAEGSTTSRIVVRAMCGYFQYAVESARKELLKKKRK